MLKQTIKFHDLDGNEVEDDFYFHVNKAELAKMVMTRGEDPEVWLQTIIDSNDGQVIIDAFEMLVKMAYGVRSEDNRRFIKTEDVWLDFYQSDAYSVFFMQLVTDAGFGAKFINGVMPADLQAEVKAELGDKMPVQDVELPELQKPDIPKDPRELQAFHIAAMTDEEFARLDRDRSALTLLDTNALLAMYERKNSNK